MRRASELDIRRSLSVALEPAARLFMRDKYLPAKNGNARTVAFSPHPVEMPLANANLDTELLDRVQNTLLNGSKSRRNNRVDTQITSCTVMQRHTQSGRGPRMPYARNNLFSPFERAFSLSCGHPTHSKTQFPSSFISSTFSTTTSQKLYLWK
jgi:hypothetical protein